VIARIPGATRPDEWVVTGNHHDASVYGADDPVGAAATLMEAARVLSELRNTGWQPNRTLVFALWEGEEQGLLGSTEWVEDHAETLREKAVICLNGDNYRRGLLTASGSSMLETFTREVFRDIRDPATGKSALEVRPDRPFGLTPIGANTDYGAFIQHLGVTSLHLAYRNVGRGTYHSAFEGYTYFLRFLDPDLSYGKSQAGAFATALLRLSDAPVLPWSFADAARAYRGWVAELPTGTDLLPLLAETDVLAGAAGSYEQSLARVMALGSDALHRHAAALARINRAIYQSERTLLFPEGLPGRPWFKIRSPDRAAPTARWRGPSPCFGRRSNSRTSGWQRSRPP
jgi:N-acetylated-alpha-linked acidic dipeptidase